MADWGYGISLRVFYSISHSFFAVTRKILSGTLEEKFHIAPMYYSLFFFLSKSIFNAFYGQISPLFGTHPLAVFINPKSGGRQGARYIISFSVQVLQFSGACIHW